MSYRDFVPFFVMLPIALAGCNHFEPSSESEQTNYEVQKLRNYCESRARYVKTLQPKPSWADKAQAKYDLAASAGNAYLDSIGPQFGHSQFDELVRRQGSDVKAASQDFVEFVASESKQVSATDVPEAMEALFKGIIDIAREYKAYDDAQKADFERRLEKLKWKAYREL